jgi:CubicO group peptidase (beta-lactamase class C family)
MMAGGITLFYETSTLTSSCNQLKVLAIHEYLSKLTQHTQFSGAVLVAVQGDVLLNRSYGFANREWDIKNTPTTRFRIASLTKQFTAACILQLQERGLLKVQDTISHYLGDYPNGNIITIHHLLTHSSGIPDTESLSQFTNMYQFLPTTIDKMILTFKDLPLQFTPGSSTQYSDGGYILLSAIIEKVSGMSFKEYLQKNIFDVAEMKDSGCDEQPVIINKRAYGYYFLNSHLLNAPYFNMQTQFGAGLIYSTTYDLFLWDQALKNKKIINEQSLRVMNTPYILATGGVGSYGYGVFVDTFMNKRRIWHTGSIIGFVTAIQRYVDDNACIIILSNLWDSPIYRIGDAIAAILFSDISALCSYVMPPDLLRGILWAPSYKE